MNNPKDPYDILGVKRTDSEETIRRAFLAKVKECHPDVNDGQGDPAAFAEIRAALEKIFVERVEQQINTSSKCKHCNGKGSCNCHVCQFAGVFRINLKSGQCTFCTK